MKTFKLNRTLLAVAMLAVTALLFVFGKNHEAEGLLTATAPFVTISEADKAGFSDEEKKLLGAFEKMANQIGAELKKGSISATDARNIMMGMLDEVKNDEGKSLGDQLKELREAASKQGDTLQNLVSKLESGGGAVKSIEQVLEESKSDLAQIHSNGQGVKYFMINTTAKGDVVMRSFDPNQRSKVAGAHAVTTSVAQGLDAATLLRLGADSQIQSQYRNSTWLLDLCNVISAGFDMPFALWYDEQAKQGASANVAEGGTKPLSQYAYTLQSDTYKKEATLLTFTEEFNLDFPRLQSDIMGKGRTDLMNRIQSAIYARVRTAATTFSAGNATAYKGGSVVANANDFDALAAMSATVDSNTFGANANVAIMSTFKNYRMGMTKDTQGRYVDRPAVLDKLAFIGNPDVAADDVLVGDLKQYNVIMRGGLILRLGYNGTDFAENKFSAVLEQYYYDYISALRKPALVKGADFAAVKTAISA
jgi:hypothetical protein